MKIAWVLVQHYRRINGPKGTVYFYTKTVVESSYFHS